jgi:glycosyltransferase involved in cell wall biosynthesis
MSATAPARVDARATDQPHPVLLLTRSLDIGGSERQLCELAKALDPRRFAVHVGSFHAGGMRAREIEAHGLPLATFPLRSYRSLGNVSASVRALRHYVRRHGIRIVHAFDPPSSAFATLASRFLSRVAVLTSQRSFRHTLPAIFRATLRTCDRLADGIVVNCEAMRVHVTADEKVPSRRVHLCYNGLDPARFGRAAAPLENLPDQAFVIGTLAALRPEKDLRTLLRAFAKAAAAAPGFVLLVVGDGPLREELKREAARLEVASQCRFLPATPDVVPWLKAMDVFVLPSIFEALSNALMEAMACGCACVATRVGGNPELVQDGDTGLLFEPGDVDGLSAQFQRLAASPALRRELGRRATAAIADRFSLHAAAARLGEIYHGHLARLDART